MRWISLPDELALSHLLELRDVAQPLRDALAELPRLLGAGSPDRALVAAGRAFGLAKGERHRYGQALALLYQAEAYRCLERWEDGLDAIRTALHWLELQVAAPARYNEAVAVYVEGVIHFTLGARERTVETLTYAQHVLSDSERHWSYEHDDLRAADCRNVMGWITNLLELQDTLPVHGVVTVLPVYVLVDCRLFRTGAIAVEGVRATMPGNVLARCLPPDLAPVQSGECVFPYLSPPSRYVAIRVSEPTTAGGSVVEGDLLIVEMTAPGSIAGSPVTTRCAAPPRAEDGPVLYRPWIRDVGIPRVLVRRGMRDERS